MIELPGMTWLWRNLVKERRVPIETPLSDWGWDQDFVFVSYVMSVCTLDEKFNIQH